MRIANKSGQPDAWRGRRGAFSMLEVVIASAVFFTVAFSVLALVTTSLAAARKLQLRQPDAGMLAAALSMTNILLEGRESGDFEDIAPKLYPGYAWSREVVERYSNSLFEVTFTVYNKSQKGPSQTETTILMFRPGSPPGRASGGLGF